MGKINPYSVTLYPATRERGFIRTSFTFGEMDKYPQKAFTADSVAHMVAAVTAFAEKHGEPCYASVRCHAARKPPGFDKATDSLYFNLDNEKEPQVA